jgi:hypothetical protein
MPHREDMLEPHGINWGEDGLALLSFGETYRALIPRAGLAVPPQADHAPYEGRFAVFLKALDDFLKSSISTS